MIFSFSSIFDNTLEYEEKIFPETINLFFYEYYGTRFSDRMTYILYIFRYFEQKSQFILIFKK